MRERGARGCGRGDSPAAHWRGAARRRCAGGEGVRVTGQLYYVVMVSELSIFAYISRINTFTSADEHTHHYIQKFSTPRNADTINEVLSLS
jgi:hypothetical protein